MRLISTGGGPEARVWSFHEALFLGQAPDGGLFVPASLTPLPDADRTALVDATFSERALIAARHFLGDELSGPLLASVVQGAFDFPLPIREIEPGIHILELFHGPTHAFKDVGARFMARMIAALGPPSSFAKPTSPHTTLAGSGQTSPFARATASPITILAATSGDTGGAVAHAFHRVPGIRVVVLYPLGRVSVRQEAQFATLGDNIAAVAVRGAFDDCQNLVRQAFADPALNTRLTLTSANSINIGRLLPQTFYHIHALAELGQAFSQSEMVVSVPSGNFGNLTAGLIARRALTMSLARFVAATNENSVVPDYLQGRGFHPRPSVATISSAMDVGDPGNFRRIAHLFRLGGNGVHHNVGGSTHNNVGGTASHNANLAAPPARLRNILAGSSWSDRQTRACIRDLWQRRGIAIDPHTAVGLLGLRHELRRRPDAVGIVLATAHPAKFAEIVEPLIGEEIPIPPGIARVMNQPRRAIEIEPELDALREVLEGCATECEQAGKTRTE